jgi:outer membrane protein OmpA-like peptidoglycan-associated protein
MRCSLLVALLALTVGCASTTAERRECHPLLSWASPAYRCEGEAPTPAVATPEPEPEPEPEEEAPPPPKKKKVEVKEESIELSEVVQFASGSDVLLPESEKLLDEVAAALNDHPEILRVRIEGHTDARAGTRYNKKLSRFRARAVRKYLISKGVKPGRMIGRGYGETKPLDSNKTREGRYKNRRVEFKILKRKGAGDGSRRAGKKRK